MVATALAATGEDSPLVAQAISAARSIDGFGVDVAATLSWCVEVGKSAPFIGYGRTRELWELLAATAAVDVAAARMLEPHLDALSILRQAASAFDHDSAFDKDNVCDGVGADAESTWGVFAAEGAAGKTLVARHSADGWRLNGTKPWCSLATHLTHALVTASVDGGRQMFAVNLRDAGVRPHAGPWVARGLQNVVSADVDFHDVPAIPVGDAGWYLQRPGFAWGGISVAACWWGAAAPLTDSLLGAAQSERADQVALVHLGTVDEAMWSARSVLVEAAGLIDDGGSAVIGERLLANRVRGTVFSAATRALSEADAALGPLPLVADERHARRIADLHLYLRQHHGVRDTERIGRALVEAAGESQ
ncbi:acyl-CoA dehydrogenase [Microbacterium lacus]|uniref:acyl-CoA dehydrogenase n=1 Tax=Microbacterium lacus TaxID=415217 RepID=UPI0038506EE9